MNRLRIALLGMVLALAVGCGYSAPSDPGNAPPPAAETNDIDIVIGAAGLTTTAFSPNPKVVSLGGSSSVTVRWVNTDITDGNYAMGFATNHSIASDNGSFAPSASLGGNATYTITLNVAGSYPYHCAIHPGMVGTITVNP